MTEPLVSHLDLRTIDDQLLNEIDDKNIINWRREFINKKLRMYGREIPLRVLIGSNSLACGGGVSNAEIDAALACVRSAR